MQKYLKIINRIFVVGLPVYFFVLANLFTSAKFKVFCLNKLLFHHECFGCGLTRAFAALSHLEFQKAYELNHLVFAYAVLFLVLWVYFLIKVFEQKDI